MSTQWLQAILIGAIVAICALMLIRRLLPGTTQRVLLAASQFLAHPQRSAFSHWLARWLQPQSGSAGCGSGGCHTCSGCGSAARIQSDAQPLVFHPKPRMHR
jgi:hypothetical protein